jgi:hypothetical protein
MAPQSEPGLTCRRQVEAHLRSADRAREAVAAADARGGAHVHDLSAVRGHDQRHRRAGNNRVDERRRSADGTATALYGIAGGSGQVIGVAITTTA